MNTEVTTILDAIEKGDARRSSELLPIVYEQLRALAANRIAKESPGQTLQATALVHEAYVRLTGDQDSSWDSRGHFFAAAAESMRRILIDRARAKGRQKRGGSRKRVELLDSDIAIDEIPEELLDLDDALTKLAEEDPVKAELVKLRYFGGLSIKHAAAFLNISPATAGRYWTYARAFLYAEITDTSADETIQQD